MQSMRVSLIIAAGGSGSRFQKGMNGHKPFRACPSKLFYSLQDEPLLIHTLNAFQKISQIAETIVAIPQEAEPHMRAWAAKHKWKNVRWVRGGKTRAESVLNALKKSDDRSPWILVQDGARPFVPVEKVKELFRQANGKTDGVILAHRVVPTIKQVASSGEIEKTIDRRLLVEAETPQLVRRSVLEKAYEENPNALEATDESALLEAMGAKVKVLTHEEWNPKITTVKDMQLAQAYMELKSGSETRMGLGKDTHRLVTGRKLYLGGILIPFEKGALGHSDGDALMHAVIDAILGAIGAGDIGEHFSDQDRKFKNMRSEKMLKAVLKEASEKGWKPVQVDTVILLEKPRLGNYKKWIRLNLAKFLNLEEDRISIKAKTAEGLGPEGEGLSLTCEALVSMKRVSL